jgi:glutaconyl-CoA/methylmalonyl-CoA decarboxylase subunit gamma
MGRVTVRFSPRLPKEQDGVGGSLGAAVVSAVAYHVLSSWTALDPSVHARRGARWSLAGRLDAMGMRGIHRERIETRKPNMPTYQVTIEGQTFAVTVEEMRGAIMPAPPTRAGRDPHPAAPTRGPARRGERPIRAPMPGKILAVHVGEGDHVSAGTVLCVLEAMKMENDLLASGDGIVRSVHMGPGDTVNTGDVMIVIEERR